MNPSDRHRTRAASARHGQNGASDSSPSWVPAVAAGRDANLGTAALATRPGRERASRIGLAALFAVGLLTAAACGDDDDTAERQEEVAERGAEVMPFDLDATTHRFEPVTDGLVQTVWADDPVDTEQIDLIQGHLEEEAERFAAGDYGDPSTIHGEIMPGLAELEAGASEIAITYEPTPEGGRITYVTDDATLVDALHKWGEAQVTDHGSHAEDGS
jgi:hypothetical protein